MELLDLLENKVVDILGKMESLRAENAKLQQEMSVIAANKAESVQALESENKQLKEALAEEQKVKSAVLARIDGILSCLNDQKS